MSLSKPTQEQIDSITRKLDMVVHLAGKNEEQVNVLVHALAAVTIAQRVEIASVINVLTAVYLQGMDKFDPDENNQDEDDYYE